MTADAKSTVVPQPKRLSVSDTKEGLIQITIQLRKFKLVVTESDYEAKYRLGTLLGELYEQFEPKVSDNGKEPEPKADADVIRENLLLNVYAPLASCSSGQVPTQVQFLRMPEADVEFWVETAKELGMKFEWLDSLEKYAESAGKDSQKKGRKSPPK